MLASRKGEHRSYLRIDIGSGICRIASLAKPISKRVHDVRPIAIADAIRQLSITVDGMGLKIKGYTSSNDWNLIGNFVDEERLKLVDIRKVRRRKNAVVSERWAFVILDPRSPGAYRLEIDGKRTRPIASNESPVPALEQASGMSFDLSADVLTVTSDVQPHKLKYIEAGRWERVGKCNASDAMIGEIFRQRGVAVDGFKKTGRFFDMRRHHAPARQRPRSWRVRPPRAALATSIYVAKNLLFVLALHHQNDVPPDWLRVIFTAEERPAQPREAYRLTLDLWEAILTKAFATMDAADPTTDAATIRMIDGRLAAVHRVATGIGVLR